MLQSKILLLYPNTSISTASSGEPPRVPDAEQLHVVDHGPTERGEVVAPHVVVGAEEHDPGASSRGHEPQHGPFESSLPLRLVWDLQRVPPGKSLDDHGPLAGVASVPHCERELVSLPDRGPCNLRDGALFATHELDSPLAVGDGEVGGVDVLHGFQGFDRPCWEGGVVVFDIWRDQDAPACVGEDVGAFFEVPVFQQVFCISIQPNVSKILENITKGPLQNWNFYRVEVLILTIQ